jgi:hypothetical protein
MIALTVYVCILGGAIGLLLAINKTKNSSIKALEKTIKQLEEGYDELRDKNYIIPKETTFGIVSYPDFKNEGGCSFSPGKPLITEVEYVFYRTAKDDVISHRDYKRLKSYDNEYCMTEMCGIKVIYKRK